jgi:hypothetical protein
MEEMERLIDLEAAPIGWQRFMLGSSHSDWTALLLSLVTYATRLLAQALRWFLGTAIKSWLRAAPYPATYKRKDAAPKGKGERS